MHCRRYRWAISDGDRKIWGLRGRQREHYVQANRTIDHINAKVRNSHIKLTTLSKTASLSPRKCCWIFLTNPSGGRCPAAESACRTLLPICFLG